MFEGWWHIRSDDQRQLWTLEPFVSVGPLRFGMAPAVVNDVMSEITGDSEQQCLSSRAQGVWTVEESEYRAFGVRLYYRDEHLAGIAVDALCGPQVTAEDMALVGRTPSLLERWMIDRAETRPPYTELSYMGSGVPASESLGVTINVQRAGDHLLTRPIFYPAQALDDLSHWLPRDAWAIW